MNRASFILVGLVSFLGMCFTVLAALVTVLSRKERCYENPHDAKRYEEYFGRVFLISSAMRADKISQAGKFGRAFPFEIVEQYEEVDQAAANSKNVIAFLPKGTALVRK